MKIQYYSPLRYPGGKASLFDFLSRTIEYNGLSNCKYVEGYAGGAGAALKLLMLEFVDDVFLNDKDELIYKFWKALLYDTENFIKLIFDTKPTMQEWKKRHQIIQDESLIAALSDTEIGFTAFFLNRCNRSGILTAGPIGGNDQTGLWKLDARYNKKDLINRINKIALYQERIHLSNMDALEFLQKIESKKFRSKEVICYLDPPYVKEGYQLYRFHYKKSDHIKLAHFLQKDFPLNWIVSYDDHPLIHDSYKEVIKNIFEFNYFANQTKVGKELLISSKQLALPDLYEQYSRTKYVNNQTYYSKVV